jgi:hypothetical protein
MGSAVNSKREFETDRRKFGRPYRVVIHGLPHFCQKLATLLDCEGWDVRYHPRSTLADLLALANDLRRCDLAYTWGGRIDLGKFLWGARCLGPTKLVMLWSGSDALWAKKDHAAGKMHPWVAAKTHWAVSPWIADEVRSVGLPCEYVQASFVQRVNNPLPMPAMFSVLAYLPSADKAQLYGWEQVVEVARALPSIEFRIVGMKGGETLHGPENVKIQGWTSDLAAVLQESSILWRPVQHDGLSFMVLEALAQGRHVLYTYPLPGCIHVKTASRAIQELKRLASLHEKQNLGLNAAGLEVVEQEFSEEMVRKNLLSRWEAIILSSGTSSNVKETSGPAPDVAQRQSI